MEAFVANISSFPTAIYTTISLIALGYWLLSIVGMFDFDIVDVDFETESGDMSFISTMLSRFGFTGAPLPLVITFLSMFSFAVCYYAVHFGLLLESAPWLTWLTGALILIGSFIVALPIAGFAIKPFRKIYTKLDSQTAEKNLLGVTCTVRSSRVDKDFGEAECQVDGASLLLKVRSDESFKRGDKVVIIEHDKASHCYQVVSTVKFNQ